MPFRFAVVDNSHEGAVLITQPLYRPRGEFDPISVLMHRDALLLVWPIVRATYSRPCCGSGSSARIFSQNSSARGCLAANASQ